MEVQCKGTIFMMKKSMIKHLWAGIDVLSSEKTGL